MSLSVQEAILGFEIPVDEVARVQVLERDGDLDGIKPRSRFRETVLARQVEEELAAVDIVDDQIELMLGLEAVSKADEKRVRTRLLENVAFYSVSVRCRFTG